MTFTVLGRCEESGQLGVGIATYSLAGGAYCPFFARERAVMSTQAFANPRLGPEAIARLEAGQAGDDVLAGLASGDPGFDYRQVSIVPAVGAPSMHTGGHCRVWAGHVVGADFSVFGNVLAGEHVVSAMAEAYSAHADRVLAERLLAALEAGRDAGGQSGEDGKHLAERSGALIIRGADIVEDIDLRIDSSADAVTDLRVLYAVYAPYVPYYALRARDPANTPAQDVWARENLSHA